MAKLTKKEKKKRSKEALNELLNNKAILNKFRVIFKMYDYEDSDVKKTVKAMVKGFMKNNDVDPETREMEELMDITKLRNDAISRVIDSDKDEVIIEVPFRQPVGKIGDRPKVVKRTSKDDVEDLLDAL